MSIFDNARSFAPALIDLFTNENSFTVERKQNSSDGAGGNSVFWFTVTTINGAIMPMRGDDNKEFDRLNIKATHSVYFKYADGTVIQVDDRLVFRDRTFRVRWIENMAEADAAIRVFCEEGAES